MGTERMTGRRSTDQDWILSDGTEKISDSAVAGGGRGGRETNHPRRAR